MHDDTAAGQGRITIYGYDIHERPCQTAGDLVGSYADPDYNLLRRVGRTPVGRRRDGYEVSTVFLGYDMSFGRGARPLLYETMLLQRGWPAGNAPVCRYSTRADAERGHALYVSAAVTLLPVLRRGHRTSIRDCRRLRPGRVHAARQRRIRTAMRHVERRRRAAQRRQVTADA